MSGRYSHNAYDHAMRDVKREDRQAVGEVLDAMHDRERLELDASVCARTFLNEIVTWLNERERDLNAAPLDWGNVARRLAAQFGDQP